MRRGGGHQCGYNSQKGVRDFLQNGVGVGAILSPRDLALDNARSYARAYRAAGAGVLLDPQFYEPEYSAGKLPSYPMAQYRQSITALGALSAPALAGLAGALENENSVLGCDAVIAPAIPYEAARPDLAQLNARLFEAAKAAGDRIGIPTYATVVMGSSVTTASVAQSVLSSATALAADGWYYAFEFDDAERLPTDAEVVFRYCVAGLTLACTGKPVLHAFAGPLSNLAAGSGARGVAVGFWQNLWGFTRSRFQPPAAQRGGGDAPPRFFSAPLWGTIVYPDEVLQLHPALQTQVLSHSPYSAQVQPALSTAWRRWDAHQHMVYKVIEYTRPLVESRNSRAAMQTVVHDLSAATLLHSEIASRGLNLRDESGAYQPVWASAGDRLINDCSEDFDWLELQGGP